MDDNYVSVTVDIRGEVPMPSGPSPEDVAYTLRCEEHEAKRNAIQAQRLRKESRHRIALAVFRDTCALERSAQPIKHDQAQDYASHATEAVEAADALLAALDHDPIKSVLPDYVK